MTVRIIEGDCREVLATLPDESVHCVVTSPPYFGLRDYGVAGQTGLEPTPDAFIAELVAMFRLVRRVLRDDGTLWLNLGDSYTSGGRSTFGTFQPDTKQATHSAIKSAKRAAQPPGLKPKDLLMIPARVALALQADGWWLRSDIIWHKPNPMPESVTDRPTSAHEHVFLLAKSARYFFDAEAVREGFADERMGNPGTYKRTSAAERKANNDRQDGGFINNGGGWERGAELGGRNLRNVWTIATAPFSDWAESVRHVHVACDADVDGKKRIASQDCPVHGDHPGRSSNVFCGGHAGDLSSRNDSNGSDLALEQPADFAPIATPLERAIAGQSLNSPHLGNEAAASRHSTQTSKTGRAPVTTAPCNASAGMESHTGDTSASPGRSGSAGHMPGSNSEPGASADLPSAETLSHNAGKSSSRAPQCTCEWYIEITEKTSHFATFPPDLVIPCIKAGTSERGCCVKCGAPWGRIVERTAVEQCGVTVKQQQYRDQGLASNKSTIGRTKAWTEEDGRTETLGWRPGCECLTNGVPYPLRPCTVLDPFGGAGTVGLVADRLQRNAFLIELNPEYAAMARNRIATDGGMFAQVAE